MSEDAMTSTILITITGSSLWGLACMKAIPCKRTGCMLAILGGAFIGTACCLIRETEPRIRALEERQPAPAPAPAPEMGDLRFRINQSQRHGDAPVEAWSKTI